MINSENAITAYTYLIYTKLKKNKMVFKKLASNTVGFEFYLIYPLE
jgi:hypothetical protein